MRFFNFAFLSFALKVGKTFVCSNKIICLQVKAEELTFPKTSRHHSGVYTCSADNGWGSAAQARIVLDVQVNFQAKASEC